MSHAVRFSLVTLVALAALAAPVAARAAPASTSFTIVGYEYAFHGGTISTLQPGTSCTNQRYLVTGALQDVLTSTTSGGAGSFSVTLTHYRYSLFGHCVIYKARVVGTVSFSY